MEDSTSTALITHALGHLSCSRFAGYTSDSSPCRFLSRLADDGITPGGSLNPVSAAFK